MYKVVDELLVNASDNRQRDPQYTNRIRMSISERGETPASVEVWNSGRGVPVRQHPTEKMWTPQLVFGNLLTGSNFDDTLRKVTGGRNGYGAKLANIFSTRFVVETLDARRKLRYRQEWRDNMSVCLEPEIERVEGVTRADEFTSVRFEPDLARFGVKTLYDDDLVPLLRRRAFDVAGCNEGIEVSFNGRRLPSSFHQYIDMFHGGDRHQGDGGDGDSDGDGDGDDRDADEGYDNGNDSPPIVYTRVNARWQIGVTTSPDGQFMQQSFVNSIHTSRGGTHVQYVADQLCKAVAHYMNRRFKNEFHVTPMMVRQHLSLFVNCLIENPAFDSQTKGTLTTKSKDFGSLCNVPQTFIDRVLSETHLVDRIVNWSLARQRSELAERHHAPKNSRHTRVLGVPKLDDANWAGGDKSMDCTLILTEGDSAKALAVAGLAVLGRDKYGAFPLKGKLLNVRDARHQQLVDNAELSHIQKILALRFDRTYETDAERRELRYGKVMLMTDQDHDGSHIKGLFINYIHHFWPALLQSGDFLCEFVTPIVKARKRGQKAQSFFTLVEYDMWKRNLQQMQAMGEGTGTRGWTIKYYKGLGTNTADEAREYFRNIKRHMVTLLPSEEGPEHDKRLIEMAFAKANADQRKAWINGYDESKFVDHSRGTLNIDEFINTELIQFSRADVIRSIPSVVDGLKPGQRKVLFACFKRKLENEIKVAQLAGYVSEHAGYHHGEVSLHSTIVDMAQTYVGSNNVALLEAGGQFGTRLDGGKDAASARYIFTRLHSLARLLFPAEDDAVLNYLDDDGFPIQPEYYVPIIPTVLLNGAEGLGTGWSTQVPAFDPRQIVRNLRLRIRGQAMEPMEPWFRGFTGAVQVNAAGTHFTTTGVVSRPTPTTLEITELPVRRWTNDYKQILETIVGASGSGLKGYTEHHTEDSVHFVLEARSKQALDSLYVRAGGTPRALYKRFKLESSTAMTNMHLFDSDGRIRRFESPLEVLEEFYPVRLRFYAKRRSFMLARLRADTTRLQNQWRFVRMVADGELKVASRKKRDLVVEMGKLGFVPEARIAQDRADAEAVAVAVETDSGAIVGADETVEEVHKGAGGEQNRSGDKVQGQGDVEVEANGYDYLLNTPVYSLTQERLERLAADKEKKVAELTELEAATPEQLWETDLARLETALEKELRRDVKRMERQRTAPQETFDSFELNMMTAAERKKAKAKKAKAKKEAK